MIIALMNDIFNNKAKEDGKLGLLMYRVELINDYERLMILSLVHR
ncbi:20863_t:CDS:2 [Rhizophagus irregularis]|nr:20863_t:CDS:2 [Rhizophagus irregularis]